MSTYHKSLEDHIKVIQQSLIFEEHFDGTSQIVISIKSGAISLDEVCIPTRLPGEFVSLKHQSTSRCVINRKINQINKPNMERIFLYVESRCPSSGSLGTYCMYNWYTL